jgi:hypothetical protein
VPLRTNKHKQDGNSYQLSAVSYPGAPSRESQDVSVPLHASRTQESRPSRSGGCPSGCTSRGRARVCAVSEQGRQLHQSQTREAHTEWQGGSEELTSGTDKGCRRASGRRERKGVRSGSGSSAQRVGMLHTGRECQLVMLLNSRSRIDG